MDSPLIVSVKMDLLFVELLTMRLFSSCLKPLLNLFNNVLIIHHVITYKVKAKLIRAINSSHLYFIVFEDKFENENPIVAREKAFNHYQNYIDVLLQGNEKTYTAYIYTVA